MANYDSDSSAGEEEEFTETNVLLGYASQDPGDDSISRLGGRPEWLDAETPPSAALAKCNICKNLMVLLLQLNAELPDRFPGHERRLYVFACQKKSCRRRDGSIRALRTLRVAPGSKVTSLNSEKKKKEEKPKPKEEPKPPTKLGETLFGAKTLGGATGANPFATSTSSTPAPSNPFASPSNPFSTPQPAAEVPKVVEPEPDTKTDKEAEALPKTFAETLSLNNPQANVPQPPTEPWPLESLQPKPYPISYLSEAEYETLDPTPPPVPQATMKMDVDDNSGSGGGKEDKEVFESTMDAAFQRFADRLAQNPEQSIRYEFGGMPLLYSKTDAVGKALAASQPDGVGVTVTSGGGVKGMPRCPNCGGPRTFEVQLCPHAITELEAEELSLEGMDWGTIIVGVCERDCQARGVDEGQVGYLEEWAGVQWEEIGSAAPGGGRR
ncbi:programmed cell death protein 2 [Xylaria bambusicola]|uniref:programmed cell death protein 2 n=1 Tax=Xylaria bambusicola TaxID=326684 RepID=UPI0020074BF3|nr:programmed cell death protein 2 [Xylaria bambusicola]KAI0506494.1 programmed cell death protein 2 [Xylaria bambusicola]